MLKEGAKARTRRRPWGRGCGGNPLWIVWIRGVTDARDAERHGTLKWTPLSRLFFDPQSVTLIVPPLFVRFW